MRTQNVLIALYAAVCSLLLPNPQAAAQGSAGVASLSATSLAFSGEPVGTTSQPQVLTLTNTGNAVLNIVSIAVAGGDFLDFSQTNTCDNSVAAGSRCVISVTFGPQSFGTRKATLIITSSASNSPQAVVLTGMGMGPAASFSATTLSFSSQLVTTSVQQAVTLSSVGNQPLAISSISVTGPFGENNTCLSSVLNPGEACSITVFFTPLAGGPATGQMTVNDNAFPPQQTVQLSGVGADFSLSLNPASNSTPAGQSASYTVSVTPTGGFTGGVILSCSGLPQGVACTFASATITVTGSSASTSTLTVTTTAASRVPTGGWRRSPPGILLPALFLGTILGCFAGFTVLPKRMCKSALVGAVATAVVLGSLLVTGCGGGSSSKTTGMGTIPMTYRMVVAGTASAGSNTVQNTVVLILVVT